MASAAPLPSSSNGILFFGRREKLFDLFAASPLILWNIAAVVLQWKGFHGDLTSAHPLHVEMLALLDLTTRVSRFAFSLLLVALLIARRTPLKHYPGILPKMIALFGAYGAVVMQVIPVDPPLSAWLIGSALLSIGGIGFAIYSLSYLGRSISVLPQSRKLVISGPYAIVRHPLYLGEQASILGIALQSTSPLVITILAVQMLCQVYRMRCEEQVLSETFPEYEAYRKRTPFIIPGIY